MVEEFLDRKTSSYTCEQSEISDISQDLCANTLVYVDDTKVKQRVTSETDVEELQQELIKLNNGPKQITWNSTKGNLK